MNQRSAFDQPDLFRMHRPNRPLGIAEQIALISLVGNLLLEVLSGKASMPTGKEGGGEQDHD
jgi:hypothetical protein